MDSSINDAAKVPELAGYAEKVKKAKANIIEAAEHFRAMIADGRVPEAFTNATPFLDMMGDTILGWMHVWQLAIAHRKFTELCSEKKATTPEERSRLIQENAEAAFYSGKIHSAQFFLNKILPIQEGKFLALKNADVSPLEIEDCAYGEEVTQ